MDSHESIKNLNNTILDQYKDISGIISKLQIIQYPWITSAREISEYVKNTHFSGKNVQVFTNTFSPIFQTNFYDEFIKNYNHIDAKIIDVSDIKKLYNFFGNINGLKLHDFNFDDIYEEKEIEPLIILDQSSQLKRIITNIYHDNTFIYKLEPRKFEEVIAELLFKKGFEVELTKQTRDNGYDIIALQNVSGFPIKFLVECKRHNPNRPVGIEIIRSFRDVIAEENANKGIIVTSSYFTKPVIQRKEKLGNLIDLADKNEILQWIFEYVTKP